jgi:hypothetical protein
MPIFSKGALARLGILAGLLVIALIIGWIVMFRMPGSTFKGKLPALNDREAALVDELREIVATLADDIGERNTIEFAQLERAADFLERELDDAGYTSERQRYDVDGQEVSNIIAELPGTRRKDEIIVIGAHYDTVPGCPGANDNATGVAALVALARTFADRRVARTLRFACFVNEEPPYFQTERMGSLVYARSCQERGDNVVAMLSLETMGYYSDKAGSQRYPALVGIPYPSTGNFISFIGNVGSGSLVRKAVGTFRQQNRFPSEGAAIPGFLGAGWSDNWSFAKVGYDALMVTDTAPFRYPHYHRLTDTVDQIDFDRLARVVAGLDDVILQLSRGN